MVELGQQRVALGGALQVLKLTRVRDRHTLRQRRRRNGGLDVAHNRRQIAPAHIDKHEPSEPPVFATDHGRPVCHFDACNLAKRQKHARSRHDRKLSQPLWRVPQFARIAQTDRIAGTAINKLANDLAANRARHDFLYVGDIEAEARQALRDAAMPPRRR